MYNLPFESSYFDLSGFGLAPFSSLRYCKAAICGQIAADFLLKSGVKLIMGW